MEKKKIYQINLDWATDSNDTDVAIQEAKSIFPNCDISAEYYDYYNCIIITAVGALDNLVPGLIKYFGPDMFSAIEFFAQDNDISNAEAEELLNKYWSEQEFQDNSVDIFSSSEHIEGKLGMPNKYYGYLTVDHPDLGKFYISAGTNGDVRLDGQPWQFLRNRGNALTKNQKTWVKGHMQALSDFARTGEPKTTLRESLTDDPGEYFSLLLE